jgi:arylsulfatase A-like enzyme
MRVPFIVKTPSDDLRGVRVDAQVSLVDVFPTVLSLAGLDAPAGAHGRSLVPLMFRPDVPETVYAYSESMTPDHAKPIEPRRVPHRGAAARTRRAAAW